MFQEIDNSIIDESRIISPNFEIENKDPNDDDISDLDLTESYGFRIKATPRVIINFY